MAAGLEKQAFDLARLKRHKADFIAKNEQYILYNSLQYQVISRECINFCDLSIYSPLTHYLP